ncbi:histone deacetylation protein Rxt3-domain-containing protein, partial [Delphinella strobiligena]
HHHHHHHAVHAHPPHHHHHTQKALPAPRQPDITVSNQALLSSISHRPRKHLGSELYATKLGLPPRDSTPLDAKFHFRSRMKLLPRFEGKENCTFTIRVPRAYLASTSTPEDEQNAIAGGLEEICRTRAIWGAEVYTDDSDVVAAAVHSGWLCGDFGEYNDDIHEIFGEEFADQTNASLGNIISEKPKTPVRPIPNSDLHVTVLVVPPLTSYAATTQHHLRSRGWGCDHDGMSIMIHSLQFVNEAKTNRFTERGGAAKHQRI